MKKLVSASAITLLMFIGALTTQAQTAEELYARSKTTQTEPFKSYLTHIENEIALVSIHQGTSVSFDGDQGQNYWQRRKDSPRFFVLIRFKDGTRSFTWIENTPTEISDKLYAESTPLELNEDGKLKVLAEMKSLSPIKDLLGDREIRVHQLTLLSPVTVFSVSH